MCLCLFVCLCACVCQEEIEAEERETGALAEHLAERERTLMADVAALYAQVVYVYLLCSNMFIYYESLRLLCIYICVFTIYLCA